MQTKNRVEVRGYVGKEPEVGFLPNGTAKASLRVATTRVWSDKATNEKREATEWHNVVVFGKQAEFIRSRVKKGAAVDVEGRLQSSTWDDKKTGEKRSKVEIISEEFTLLERVTEATEPEYAAEF